MNKVRAMSASPKTKIHQTYTFEEAFEASKDYFFGNELAAKVCIDKYYLRNEQDELVERTPEDMHIRLASEFARIDYEKYGADYNKQYKLYYDRFKSFSRLVPQGSPMAAIGNPYQTLSASNCVVIESPEDSISGIMKTATELAQLFKRRAGVGTDISKLRPDGFRVKNAARTTSGAWSFADLFSYITGKIGQCLHEDTKILTRKGIKEIKNVHPSNEVWTKKGWIPVTGTIKNKKSCVKVTTKFGHEIICSEDHVFHTTEGEKAIKDLVVGDLITQIVGENGWEGGEISLVEPTIKRIGVNKSCRLNTNINFPKLLSEKLAYIIGYSYGDGSVDYNEVSHKYDLCLSLDPAWDGIISKLKQYLLDTLEYKKEETAGDGCKRIRITSKLIIDYFRANKFLKQKSEAIVFPPQLLKSKSSVIFAFISGYFDADGDVSKKKSYRFRSVRRGFLAEIQNVLFAHGIPSKIHTRERKEENWRTIYTLSVNGGLAQANFRKFMKESVKVASYPEFEKATDHTRTAYQTKDFGTKASRHKYIIDDSQWITYSTSRRLCDDINIKSDYYLLQDEITDIELYDSGKQQTVYDLMLPDEHLFFANGMYAHNSGRRGALMVTISVHHPDIEKFAKMKADKTAVTKANVSIRITDEFMRAVESDSDYEQRWPCEGEAQFSEMVSAKAVWNTIIEMATLHAEPGLIFWDNATERLPAESYEDFKSVCVNPCGEIILAKNGSCRLLSMNLTGYVRNAFTSESFFDYKTFEDDAKIAMRLLDNLVDLELELIERILKSCDSPEEVSLWNKLYKAGEQGRRTGLGTHGLADTLAQLRIKYDSDEALKWADQTYKALRNSAYSASVDLAEERGAFPVFDWNTEKDNPFIQDLPETIKKRMAVSGRRNISILTQAPTGTVALVSKCGNFDRHSVSSGVEPTYRLSYTKRKKINRNDSNSKVDHVDELGDRWQDYRVVSSNLQNYYEVENSSGYSDPPDYFVTSDKIDWQFRVKLQGTEQKYIDHCISSTVNLPKGTPPEVVGGIYMKAWKENLKGITVYVDGSRMGVMLEDKPKSKIVRHKAPERPRDLPCDIHFHTVKGEPWTALVGCLEGEPYELFGGYGRSVSLPQKYKKGFIRKRGKGKYDLHIPVGGSEFLIIRDIIRSFNDDEIGWTTRLVSLALIHGAKIDSLVTSLQKDGNLHSFNKVLARVLKKYIPNGQKVESSVHCGECGSAQLVWQEGCVMCASCGHSKCM